MNKLPFLIILFSILNCAIAFSQTREIKLYTGLIDRVGLAFEYTLNDKTGIEIGGSFNSSKFHFIDHSSPGSDSDDRWNALFLNLKLKRYIGDSSLNSRFYYGGYLRYARFSKTASDISTWTQGRKDYAAKYNVVLSEQTNKFSIGALFGVKGKILKSLTWELSMGAGFSPPPLYFQKSEGTKWNKEGPVGPVESEAGDMLPGGYFYHLSLLGHVSIGYAF